ncbi:MAG: DUF3990 domain-containing protein [Lachnospiraceae bacterium]|nr:DUF3990 domain-containing protein [Lachnospiraceae bacterium]
MLGLSDGMLLYHGGYCEVNHPNLAKCAGTKDFGRGFYLTSSREQAENFINTSGGGRFVYRPAYITDMYKKEIEDSKQAESAK